VRSPQSGLRTVDVARRAGYSVQQVRDLEGEGVLQPAARTPAGYRVYTEAHVLAVLAYRSLAAGVGPVEAKRLLRAAHERPVADLLALLDAAHVGLHTERRELALAQDAVRAIAAEPVEDTRPADSMSISELAGALGVRLSTLRHWEAEGLLTPHRASAGRTRTYTPSDVRDARIVHQLRAAGYRIAPLRALMPELRGARRWDEVTATLAAREVSITARSRALLEGTAALHAVLAGTHLEQRRMPRCPQDGGPAGAQAVPRERLASAAARRSPSASSSGP
jgi:DNA-binding transcriptional MerR regulator